MKLNPFLKKVLTTLKARPLVGGLEVSDSVLRFALLKGETWETATIRLSSGVVVAGEIKDRDAFLEALRALHAQIAGEQGERKKINVIVSLSSANIYTQVFNLPFVEGENLERAVELNIQMVSPEEFSKTYSGWQLAQQDEKRAYLEILSAFINRSFIDPLARTLQDTGFLPVVVEPKSLSMVRLIAQASSGFDKEKPSLVLILTAEGINFLVIRHGQLYFDYFTAWGDIQKPGEQISMEDLERVVVRNLHQVLNFYHSHWQEQVADVLISVTGLTAELRRIVQSNFSLNVAELQMPIAETLGQDWIGALGAGLRGALPREEDSDLSLLGVDAPQEFRDEQVLAFSRFWRTIVPATLLLFGIVLTGADIYLSQLRKQLEANVIFTLLPQEAKEIASLEGEARSFNRLVSLAAQGEKAVFKKTPLLGTVSTLAQQNRVLIDRFYFQSPGTPLLVNAHASSEEAVLQFKKAIESSGMFRDINLPIANVQKTSQGVTFSISFSLNS